MQQQRKVLVLYSNSCYSQMPVSVTVPVFPSNVLTHVYLYKRLFGCVSDIFYVSFPAVLEASLKPLTYFKLLRT